MGKLILIMIDGISADHFERYRPQLPNLDYLAKTGTQMTGVRPETFGTSAPGRASIVCGVPSFDHGIYGNAIFSDGAFRWANPYDVKVDTLPKLAKDQGLDVACIGYGMVRPEDCTLYHGPWWVDEMMMARGKDKTPYPADEQWLRAGVTVDSDNRIGALQPEQVIAPNHTPDNKLNMGMLADHQLMDIAAGLATSDKAPDFILLETCIPDYFLHKYGEDHDQTRLALRAADAQIGTLLNRLRYASVLDQYNFAICSDHGHGPMTQGLYVDQLLGKDVVWSSEGAVLLVHPTSDEQAEQISQTLLAEGLEVAPQQYDNNEAHRLLAFTVPKGSNISFEATPTDAKGVYGPSKYTSNHGMRPDTWREYRFCIFAGPDVPQQKLGIADQTSIAPTMAEILGVKTPWASQSVLKGIPPQQIPDVVQESY